jgi:hypothetical protein
VLGGGVRCGVVWGYGVENKGNKKINGLRITDVTYATITYMTHTKLNILGLFFCCCFFLIQNEMVDETTIVIIRVFPREFQHHVNIIFNDENIK